MADPRALIEEAEDSTPDRVNGAPRYRTANGVANFLRSCEGEGEIYARLDLVHVIADSVHGYRESVAAEVEEDLDEETDKKVEEVLTEKRPRLRREAVHRIGNILGDMADDTPEITGELGDTIDEITAQYGAHKAALLAASALVVEWSMTPDELKNHLETKAGKDGRAQVSKVFGEKRAAQLLAIGKDIDFDAEES